MRFVFAAALSSLVAGCTLLVSTSGFDDGTGDASAPSPSPRDSGRSNEAASIIDSGSEADQDAGKAPVPELPGLIGAWLFDNGTPNDSSGRAHHGTFQGDATIVDTDRGKAMHLSGNGSMRVDSLLNAAFPTTGTISLWFQYATMAAADEHGFFDSWDSARDHIFVRHANGDAIGTIQIAFQTPTNYEVAATFDLGKNTWTHVVVTWDAGQNFGRVYADDKPLASGKYADGVFTPGGQHCIFGERVDGSIDDIRLYDRALSESEIVGLP